MPVPVSDEGEYKDNIVPVFLGLYTERINIKNNFSESLTGQSVCSFGG